MVVRSIFFILLFAVLLCHSATAQDTTEEQSTGETTSNDTSPPNTTTPVPTTAIPLTTPSTSCKYPDEFPLFGDDTCISRAAYTAIFLISIILAGISFLMLIGLLILYCARHSRNDDDDDNESNDSRTGERKSVSRHSTMPRSRELYASPARHEEPMQSTNAPYAPVKSVPKVVPRSAQTNPKQQRSDSIEMDYRPTNKPPPNPSRTKPSSTPKITDLDDVRERSHNRVTPPIEDTETSYF